MATKRLGRTANLGATNPRAVGVGHDRRAVFWYDAGTPFPGLRALPTVLGTVLMLAFVRPDRGVRRLLTLRPVLWLGAISYSAYLWHQPLFAFARLGSANEPPAWVFGGLAALSLLLGYLSWHFVEAPFRAGSRWSRQAVFAGSAVLTIVFIGCGAMLVVTQGLPQRWSAATGALIDPPKTRIVGRPAVDDWLQVRAIGQPGQPAEVVLLGDSHADALATALDDTLRRAGKGGVVVHTACHPIAGLFDSREPTTPQRVAYCAEADRRLLEHVARPEVRGVLLAVRWTARLYPMGDRIDAQAFDNHEGGVERNLPFRRNLALDDKGRMSDDADPKQRRLARYLADLAALRPTLVLDPVPEVGWTPQRLNLLAVTAGHPPPAFLSTAWDRYRERNAVALELLHAVALPQLLHSQPQALLCNTAIAGRCVVQAEGVLYYADDNHLSARGAQPVVDDMLARLPLRP